MREGGGRGVGARGRTTRSEGYKCTREIVFLLLSW